MDEAAVHRYLSGESYWAHGIERGVLDRALDNSLCFALRAPDGSFAGFARAVTDRATFGYLADVFVLDAHRGRGLGRWLVQTAVEHPELRTLRRWVLFTADARELYVSAGFRPAAAPETFMERRREGGPAGG